MDFFGTFLIFLDNFFELLGTFGNIWELSGTSSNSYKHMLSLGDWILFSIVIRLAIDPNNSAIFRKLSVESRFDKQDILSVRPNIRVST